VKRRRLNALLELQEGIGLEANRSWLGRTTEVLVEGARPGRAHDHGGAAPALDGRPEATRLVGRNREHRLVHADGPAEVVGRFVPVVIERAGPYSLAGRLAS
jgi:tRNA A37 methylthiotransferase MiaB